MFRQYQEGQKSIEVVLLPCGGESVINVSQFSFAT
jgi:hypothetical protein